MPHVGAELLAHKANAYLPHIARKIIASGGDIINYQTNCLLCIFPPSPETLHNPYEIEFKSVETKWRKYQNLSLSVKNIIANDPEKQQKLNNLNAKFEAIKQKFIHKKFENEKQQKQCIQKNVFAAILCANKLQQEFGNMDLGVNYSATKNKRKKKHTKFEFRIKIGIGVGKTNLVIIGGAKNGNVKKYQYLICGDAVIQAFDCVNDCDYVTNRMVVISQNMYNIEGISDYYICGEINKFALKKDKQNKLEHLSSYNITNTNSLLVHGYIRQLFLVVYIPDTIFSLCLLFYVRINLNNRYCVSSINKKRTRVRIRRTRYDVVYADEYNCLASKVVNYVTDGVRLYSKTRQRLWTAELRELTILHASLSWNIRYLSKLTRRMLNKLHNTIVTIQLIIYKCNGCFNKFIIDDRGSYIMATFYGSVLNAVYAALMLEQNFNNIGIGLSYGTVFTGIMGSRGIQRTYDVIGESVSLSARLMAISKKNPVKLGKIVVDKSVYVRAKTQIPNVWKNLSTFYTKGRAETIQIYTVLKCKIPINPVSMIDEDKYSMSFLITRYMVDIYCEIDLFLKNDRHLGKVFLFEYEPGNETNLFRQIQLRNSKDLWFLYGKAYEYHKYIGTKYIIWKQIMMRYSSKYSLLFSQNRYRFKLWVKQRRCDLLCWLFLVNEFVDLGDYKLVQQEFVSCDYSKANLNKKLSVKCCDLDKYRFDIMFLLLEWSARIKPIAIVIDNLHFLNEKDLQMTRRLSCLIHKGILKNIILLISSTPIYSHKYDSLFKDKYIEIKQTFCKHKIVMPLKQWNYNETKHFMCNYINVAHWSNRIIMMFDIFCGGRP
eukprot:432212_1